MARVVMLGSAFEVRGGVSAVAQVYAHHGLFDRTGAEYLATHCDGRVWDKLRLAARSFARFARLLRRREVSLVHVHLNSDASFWRKAMFVLAARAHGVPYILHLHCGKFGAFYNDRCPPWAQRFVRWVLRGARHVVALSAGLRETLRLIEPALAPHVIPNPVIVPPWRARLEGGAPTVLFLGMVTEAKGAFDLLRAWPAVLESVPDARLVLAGSGELERARKFAEEQGFANSLELPGWVGPQEKAALLKRAWVATLPSHWEAMPMAVLEAQGAGLPVVASSVGAIPAVVEHGATGFLCTPRDINALAEALGRLLADFDLRLAMGRAGRERALKVFSPAVVVPQIEALWAASPTSAIGSIRSSAPVGLRGHA